MDEQRQSLEEKADELRSRLDRLEEEWETLSCRVSRMTVSKLTDPRHPLIDWELHHVPSEAAHQRFHAAMKALQNRVTGTATAEHEQAEIEGLTRATLYSPTLPNIAEIMDALKIVTGGTERSIVKLMEAAKDEQDHDYDDLAEFVLDSTARQ